MSNPNRHASGPGDCPAHCGRRMVLRFGRNGGFYGCAAYPSCRHTEPLRKPLKDPDWFGKNKKPLEEPQ
jgi:ssDNA-binding Zn-finger/Zn-ribbon topoisomerase 1